MINTIEPNLQLSKVGDGSTVISGTFDNPHDKSRIYALLESAGIDMKRLMDLTTTKKVNKMVRTKLYLVEINNNKAKDLGGITGISYFSEYAKVTMNPLATNGATFSGWLLDNMGDFSSIKGNSVSGTLNFLEQSGIGKILDDTVLITTEDKNASFRVGGEVYIPTGMTQNAGLAPTIELEEKEYGLKLVLSSTFMQRDKFLHIEVDIKNSQFDTDQTHNVALGQGVSVPSFVSKNIQTNVVIRSGQVLALGGRLHTEDIESEEKIPILGDIPLLGELFKHTVSGVRENDLLFFLVPEIVDANEHIDDIHFYKDIKDAAKKFHDQSTDLTKNANDKLVVLNDNDNDAVSKDNDKEMVIELENDAVQTPQSSEKVQKDTLVIPAATTAVQSEVNSVNDTDNDIYKEAQADIKEVAEPKAIKEDTKEVTEVKALKVPKAEIKQAKVEKIKEEAAPVQDLAVEEQTTPKQEPAKDEDNEDATQAEEKLYEVRAAKIFLRAKPVDGRRVTVWKKGHKFTVSTEEDVEGKTWLKVKQDCYRNCEDAGKELWISSRYVEEL